MIRSAARLALALVLLAATPLAASAQRTWWESDATGLAYRPSSAALAPGLEWSLSVERSGLVETRTLYRLGSERSSLRLERDASGAVIRELETFADGDSTLSIRAPSGRLERETRVLSDASVRDTSFEYDSGSRLLSATTRDALGLILWTDTYRYGASGEPLGMERRDAQGLRFKLGSSDAAAWLSEGESRSLRVFDASGRLVSSEELKPDGVLMRRVLDYEGSSRSAARTRETEGKRVLQRSYDKEGRLVLETALLESVELSSRELQWNAAGLLEAERFRSGGALTERAFRYDATGALTWEEERLDGALVRRAVLEGSDLVEELFDEGALFARVRKREGRVIREELYADGALVRSRDFP